MTCNHQKDISRTLSCPKRDDERGAALITALVILALLGAISISVLAVASSEANVVGSDLQRTRTFYAAEAGLEKMTGDYSDLYKTTLHPTTAQLNNIAGTPPTGLVSEGFSFNQTFVKDTAKQTILNAQGQMTVIPAGGPFAGLSASIVPYNLQTTATLNATGTKVTLQRDINNYLIPLFQFGIFGSKDLEFWPNPPFTFNGRVHSNGNIYVGGDMTFTSKLTTANELVRDKHRNDVLASSGSDGLNLNDPRMIVKVGATSYTVHMTQGSVNNGPSFSSTVGARGYAPNSPTGTINTTWDTTSVLAPPTIGTANNQFNRQLLTRSTGVSTLQLPLELNGNDPRELIKRKMPNDNSDPDLRDSRYHNKAQIRILIDDETHATADSSGIGASDGGVKLSVTNTTDPYYFKPKTLDGGKALYRLDNNGNYIDSNTTAPKQQNGSSPIVADTVRNVRNPATPDTSSSNIKIPGGSGLSGHILIQVVKADGTTYDVTKDILSMGVTEGEPNGIVYLQRPLWMAFTQGSRDRTGGSNYLTAILNNTSTTTNDAAMGSTGTIKIATGPPASPTVDATYSYLTNLASSTANGTQPIRPDVPTALNLSSFTSSMWNSIVPINVYNVREGWLYSTTTTASTNLDATQVYERGMTSVVEINMKNLARWVDGVYDGNLLSGTNAISTNIGGPDGYVVYISDRRGDRVKQEIDSTGHTINTTNGMCDNEDVYGFNQTAGATPAAGEDFIDSGTDYTLASPAAKLGSLQKDTLELPDPVTGGTSTYPNWFSTSPAWPAGGCNSPYNSAPCNYTPTWTNFDRLARSRMVESWTNPKNLFRRAVRLINGEDLTTTGASGKLSSTKGLTIATENMVYVWGNYNTTGINGQPTGSSTLNDSTQTYHYLGNQVPASIVADAFFPLSKTWYDAMSPMYPEGGAGSNPRLADALNSGTLPVSSETAVRAGIVAGSTLSSMHGSGSSIPSSDAFRWLNGGVHNYPRFLENWYDSSSNPRRWNYVGAFIMIYNSTQAVGPYSVTNYVVYTPPTRNWAFDDTFTNPDKLPPGTPSFEYVEQTGFRQIIPNS